MNLSLEYSLKIDKLKSGCLQGIPYIFITNSGCNFEKDSVREQIEKLTRIYVVSSSEIKLTDTNKTVSLIGESYKIYNIPDSEYEFIFPDDHLISNIDKLTSKKICELQLRVNYELYNNQEFPILTTNSIKKYNIQKSIVKTNIQTSNSELSSYDPDFNYILWLSDILDMIKFNNQIKFIFSEKISNKNFIESISSYFNFTENISILDYIKKFFNGQNNNFQQIINEIMIDDQINFFYHFVVIEINSVKEVCCIVYDKQNYTSTFITINKLELQEDKIKIEIIPKINEQLGIPEFLYNWNHKVVVLNFDVKEDHEENFILYVLFLQVKNPEFQNFKQIVNEIKRSNNFESSISDFYKKYKVKNTEVKLVIPKTIPPYLNIITDDDEKCRKYFFIFRKIKNKNLILFPFGLPDKLKKELKRRGYKIDKNKRIVSESSKNDKMTIAFLAIKCLTLIELALSIFMLLFVDWMQEFTLSSNLKYIILDLHTEKPVTEQVQYTENEFYKYRILKHEGTYTSFYTAFFDNLNSLFYSEQIENNLVRSSRVDYFENSRELLDHEERAYIPGIGPEYEPANFKQAEVIGYVETTSPIFTDRFIAMFSTSITQLMIILGIKKYYIDENKILSEDEKKNLIDKMKDQEMTKEQMTNMKGMEFYDFVYNMKILTETGEFRRDELMNLVISYIWSNQVSIDDDENINIITALITSDRFKKYFVNYK